MSDIKSIVKQLGRDALIERLDCSQSAVAMAESRGLFPAAWHPTVKRLGEEKGVEVSDNLFNWRKPEHARASA